MSSNKGKRNSKNATKVKSIYFEISTDEGKDSVSATLFVQFLVGQLDSVRLVQNVPVVIFHPVASSVVRKLSRVELKLGQGVPGANRRPQVETNAAVILSVALKI